MSKQIVQIFEAFSEKLNFMWLNDQNHNDLMIFDIENWFLSQIYAIFESVKLKIPRIDFLAKKYSQLTLVLKTPPLRSRYCTNMCWRKRMYRAELLDFSTQHKLSLQSEYFLA